MITESDNCACSYKILLEHHSFLFRELNLKYSRIMNIFGQGVNSMRAISRAIVMTVMILIALTSFSYTWKFDVKALEIDGNGVHELVNEVFEFSDDIIIEGSATLLVENATIRFLQTKSYQFEMRLQKSESGNPRLIVKNATFESSRPFRISLYDNSSAEFYGLQFDYDLELFDSSTVNVFDGSSVYYIRAYGSSNVNAVGSDVFYLYAYDESLMKISTCDVNRVEASDNSEVDVSVSSIKYSVTADDSSHVLVSYSSFSGSVLSKKTSNVLFLESVSSKANVEIRDHGNVTLLDSIILTSKFSSDFSAKDFSMVYICNSNINDVSFSGYENSTIKIENSVLTSTYIRSFENSLLQVLDSSVSWLLECEGNAYVVGVDSSFTVASGKGSAHLFFDNCTVALLRGYEASEIVVSTSIVEEVTLDLDSMNVTLSNFGTGFFNHLELIASGLNVTFLDTMVSTGWSLRFHGSSNVTFQDSELMILGASDSSKIWMWNSTWIGMNIAGASEVYVWSCLKVKAVDYFGSSIEGANVTVTLSGVPVESQLTGRDGVAIFELLEKVVNGSGSYSTGNYEVDVVFGVYSADSHISLNGSQLSVLNLQSPWWYWHMILGSIITVVVVLGLSVFLIFKRRKKSEMQA